MKPSHGSEPPNPNDRDFESLHHENDRLRSLLKCATQAEGALADSEARYRSLVEALTEGVVMQDRHGTILACNSAAERILGLTQDQMMGRSSLDPRWRAIKEDGAPYPGEGHPAMVTLRTGEPIRDAIMGVHKPDGELTWISINTQPIALGHGSRAVVASFTEITQLRTALEKLEQSEGLFRLALQAASVGVWEWAVNAEEITWTAEVYEIFGVAPGTKMTFEVYRSLIHEDDRERVSAVIQRSLAGLDGDYYIEHRIWRGDELCWIRGNGQVVRDETGAAVLMRGAVYDITQEKTLEARVLRGQRLESIGRLAGGIAHDFNNLLTALLAAVDEGRSDLTNVSQVAEALNTIDTACKHASQLTRHLLAFARQQVLDIEHCSLDRLIADTRPLLRHLLSEDVELCVELAGQDWFVKIDPTQMQQVLVNLVVNAHDAMPNGGTLMISVEQVPAQSADLSLEDAQQDWLRLRVRDTGEGMPQAVSDRVFEPFFSTKTAGTGLGLATCYGIVQQCGGRIDCASRPGAGTTFSILLPRAAPPEPASNADDDAGAVRGCGKVLVVEDQAPVLRVAERALSRAGFDVLTTLSAEEALRLLEQHDDIDVLLSDVVMPRMGGLALAQQALVKRPRIKLLFMSGYASESVLAELKILGNTELLEKPFRPSELIRRVRQLIPDRAEG